MSISLNRQKRIEQQRTEKIKKTKFSLFSVRTREFTHFFTKFSLH
jgi:hypothetical protein